MTMARETSSIFTTSLAKVFWDDPAIQAIEVSTDLLALQTQSPGDANIAEALVIYETELP